MTDDSDREFNPSAQGSAHGEGKFGHVSVLLKQAIDFLAVQRGGTYLDATVGLGGHSFEIAKRLGAQGRLIGFDKDTQALELARRRLLEPPQELRGDWPSVTLVHASYAEVATRLEQGSLNGLLADLGVSSMQFEDPARGFSFQAEGPLDMRMNPQAELTADQVVNQFDEKTLADLIYEFGEERRSRRIARAIVRARPIRTTAHLAQVVSAAARPMKSPIASKSGSRRGPRKTHQAERRIHPATLTFQALRIFVNRELEDLRALLDAASRVLRKEGRLVMISFHSLEDRMVKDELREGAREGTWEVLTRKPVTADEEEIAGNPRSRSAKMRAARKR